MARDAMWLLAMIAFVVKVGVVVKKSLKREESTAMACLGAVSTK
jgi:hypothetical protein